MMKEWNEKKEMEAVEKRIMEMMGQGFEVLKRELEEELESFYWQHYENSDIISIGQDQQSARQSLSLSDYERVNPSFLSSHSIASQHQLQNKQKTQKRSKSVNTRPKILRNDPKQINRRIKTQQVQQEQAKSK